MTNTAWSPAGKAGLVFIGYFLLGQAAIHLTIMPEGIVTFWPPNAVVVTALILSPLRHWWLLIVAGMAAEFAADIGHFPLWQIAGFALVNAGEASLVGAIVRWLYRKRGYRLFTVRAALSLGTIFLFVATPLAALGGAALYQAGDPSIEFWSFWRLWWFGDAIGLLIVTPALLVWFGESLPSVLSERGRAMELGVLSLLFLGGCGLIFFAPGDWPLWNKSPVLLLPLLVWAAVRFGLHGATASVLIMGFTAAAGTTSGLGPFLGSDTQAEVVIRVQDYLLTAVILALSLGTSFRQWSWAVADLRHEREQLEQRVAERTRELHQQKQEAEQQALTDELTALNNRRAFFQYAHNIHDQAARYGRGYSVMILDIDNFKQVNDRFGHHSGDIAIRRVADAIRAISRASDVPGRIGGEEFAICLPATSLDEAGILADRLRHSISEIHLSLGEATLQLTVSLGIAQYREGDTSFEDILKRADNALYMAKTQGRNRLVILGE
ncbi:MAG: diguanylate cyclase [Sedimenticola sp.]|nr:diguanylate cyclase [Sedimenticola sp.]